jgi:hypothetical protein
VQKVVDFLGVKHQAGAVAPAGGASALVSDKRVVWLSSEETTD